MKPLYLILGFLFTGIGFVGIFVPGLPATFPLLLAAFFFSRSSKKFHVWLLHNKLLGPYVRKLVERRGLDWKSKRRALTAMWIAIGLSILVIPPIWVKLLVACLGIIGTVYIVLGLKTLSEDSPPPT